MDGAAIGAVHPASSGTAAGVLNFLRLGSEAVFIGFYAVAVHAVIGVPVDNSPLADQIAAGGIGYGETYATAFRTALWGLIVLTVLTILAIATCHRRSIGSKVR